MNKAVIFDMDGVIIDSEPIQSRSLEILIRQYGEEPIFNEQGLIHSVGIGGDGSYLEVMEKHGIDDQLEEFRVKRRDIFVELLQESLVPRPGFIPLLKKLKKEGFKVGLASNRLFEHVILIVKNLGVENFFDIIVGPSEAIRLKPAPDIYLETAKLLNVDPNNCLALEDSETGVESAYNAKMKIIAIPNEYTNHHDFKKADKIVGSLKEIDMKVINDVFAVSIK